MDKNAVPLNFHECKNYTEEIAILRMHWRKAIWAVGHTPLLSSFLFMTVLLPCRQRVSAHQKRITQLVGIMACAIQDEHTIRLGDLRNALNAIEVI